jgi:hypothetical protein
LDKQQADLALARQAPPPQHGSPRLLTTHRAVLAKNAGKWHTAQTRANNHRLPFAIATSPGQEAFNNKVIDAGRQASSMPINTVKALMGCACQSKAHLFDYLGVQCPPVRPILTASNAVTGNSTHGCTLHTQIFLHIAYAHSNTLNHIRT